MLLLLAAAGGGGGNGNGNGNGGGRRMAGGTMVRTLSIYDTLRTAIIDK